MRIKRKRGTQKVIPDPPGSARVRFFTKEYQKVGPIQV